MDECENEYSTGLVPSNPTKTTSGTDDTEWA